MSRILIRNADWVVTVDDDRRIITDGAVEIVDDRIAFVGKSSELASGASHDEVIDARGHLVVPGFIDTHVHNTQHLGRGLGDGCDMPTLLLERLYAYEAAMAPDDAYWAARLCQLELIKAGTTCYLDPSSYYPEETARATGDTGMRGIISRTALDVQNTRIGRLPRQSLFRETTAEALERAEQTVVEYTNSFDGRVDAWFSIRIPVGCSDELCRGIKQLADKHGVGIVTHCCESQDQSVASRRTSRYTDVERLEALGVLGPEMVMIQMGWANPEEIALAQRHKFKISYTPTTGYRIALGDATFGHFPEMAALGVTVALGGNSAMSSNHLDSAAQPVGEPHVQHAGRRRHRDRQRPGPHGERHRPDARRSARVAGMPGAGGSPRRPDRLERARAARLGGLVMRADPCWPDMGAGFSLQAGPAPKV